MKQIIKKVLFKLLIASLCSLGCLSVGLRSSAANATSENWIARDEAIRKFPQGQKIVPFNASGRIARANGAGVSGVTITFGSEPGPGKGRPPGAVVTDADGRWSQSGFESGTIYTASASKTGFTFQPLTRVFSGTRTDLSFDGTTDPFSLSGTVTTSVSNIGSSSSREVGISGATISFARESGPGRVPTAVTTDSSGHWTQSGFEGDTVYRASPIKPGFDFNPTSAEFRNVKPIRDLNFAGQFNFFVVSGTVSGFSGTGVNGVTITFQRVSGAGRVPSPVQTDAQGNWNQRFEKGTTYRVTPRKEGFIFNPATSVGLLNARSNLNFDSHSVRVKVSSRVVRFRDNTPISSAILNFLKYESVLGSLSATIPADLGQPGPPQVQTDADGNWSQLGFSRNATYRVLLHTPDFSIGDLGSFVFRVEEDARDEITVPDIRVRLSYTVSGRVAYTNGTGIVHVRISFLDDRGRAFDSTETNSSGNWSRQFKEGATYQVKAAKPGFHFSPAIYSFDGPRTNLDFVPGR